MCIYMYVGVYGNVASLVRLQKRDEGGAENNRSQDPVECVPLAVVQQHERYLKRGQACGGGVVAGAGVMGDRRGGR